MRYSHAIFKLQANDNCPFFKTLLLSIRIQPR